MIELHKQYRHYKGGIYIPFCLANHSETKEEMVVYYNVQTPRDVWVRPSVMWDQEIAPNVIRFTKINPETESYHIPKLIGYPRDDSEKD